MASPTIQWGGGDRDADEVIDAYLSQGGAEFFYEYDFGDAWGHILKLEKMLTDPVEVPVCLEGTRACPPEDCGGPWLYDEFLRSRQKKAGRVSPKWQEHIGSYWDSEGFDRARINQELAAFWQHQ
jgi:hypothetical protein